MESASYVSCLAWIHKGYAAHVPKEIELSEQEVMEMKADPMVQEKYLISYAVSTKGWRKRMSTCPSLGTI